MTFKGLLMIAVSHNSAVPTGSDIYGSPQYENRLGFLSVLSVDSIQGQELIIHSRVTRHWNKPYRENLPRCLCYTLTCPATVITEKGGERTLCLLGLGSVKKWQNTYIRKESTEIKVLSIVSFMAEAVQGGVWRMSWAAHEKIKQTSTHCYSISAMDWYKTRWSHSDLV